MTTAANKRPETVRRPSALDALADRIAFAAQSSPLIRVGGIVTEVAPTHFRVSGLSRHLTLGQCVSFEPLPVQQQIAEVVHIDEAGATVKPFDANLKTGIGEIAWKHSSLALRRTARGRAAFSTPSAHPSTAQAPFSTVPALTTSTPSLPPP